MKYSIVRASDTDSIFYAYDDGVCVGKVVQGADRRWRAATSERTGHDTPEEAALDFGGPTEAAFRMLVALDREGFEKFMRRVCDARNEGLMIARQVISQ